MQVIKKKNSCLKFLKTAFVGLKMYLYVIRFMYHYMWCMYHHCGISTPACWLCDSCTSGGRHLCQSGGTYTGDAATDNSHNVSIYEIRVTSLWLKEFSSNLLLPDIVILYLKGYFCGFIIICWFFQHLKNLTISIE